MKTTSKREWLKVLELARAYRAKGYQVITPRGESDVPAFLRETKYLPDLIATSEKEKLVIEVKTQETARALEQLDRVSEIVNEQPGWQFVLVFTNPRGPSKSVAQATATQARRLLEKVEALGTADGVHIEAAFLFAWAAFEAALRLLPMDRKHAKHSSTAPTLIRNATMAGYVDRKDAHELERLFRVRNSLLHSVTENSPAVDDIALLRRLTEEVVQASMNAPLTLTGIT